MNSTEKFWNRVADRSGNTPGKTALKTIALTKAYLKAGDMVLDFGCGSGGITNPLAKEVRHIDAIDISAKMIANARGNADKLGLQNISYQQAELTVTDEKNYDVIVSFNVLHYINNLETELRKVSGLLKPNGLFISSTVCLKEGITPARILMYVLSKTGLVPKTVFYTKNTLESLIQEAGFTIANSVKISNLNEYFIVAKKAGNE